MGNKYEEITIPADVSRLQASAEGGSLCPYVVVLTGASVGSVFRLSEDENVIGRASDCHIMIKDESISRVHAQLVRTDEGRFLIQDLRSTNGTYKNGRRITSAPLEEGERFRVGGTTLLRLSLSEEVEISFRKLYDASVRDPLTGLHNRRHFTERLGAELSFSARHSVPLALLMLDLDHFKQINDTYGHQAGDQVLRKVSELLQSSIRAEDVVARYGGEEFVILAPGIDMTQSRMLADRIRKLVEKLALWWNDDVISVTLSAGVACHIPPDVKTNTELIENADRALYKAKAQGRNRVELA